MALTIGAPQRAPSQISKRRRYERTAEVDGLIREAYLKLRQGDKHALKAASCKLGWPCNAVCKRGAELGLTRTKERPWSPQEEDILVHFGHLTPTGLQRRLSERGFSRSVAAIQIKLNRWRIKQNLDGYSANTLAGAFGIDVHKVLLWIRRGLLKARRRGTDRIAAQGGDVWWIARREVRRFVLSAPEEIDLARVEKIWFLDLITEGKICA